MCVSTATKKKIFPIVLLLALIAAAVGVLFYIDGRMFPSEVSVKFDKEEDFLNWYEKALGAYQAAAPLFSAWAASCIVAGYTLDKDLTKTSEYVVLTLIVFVLLIVFSVFDLYLSQAYFSYYTYVFNHSYPVFENTIAHHVSVQKTIHLLMLICVSILAGISFIRKLA